MHLWPVIIVAAGAVLSAAPDAGQTEFFEKNIRPILAERCYGCHGPKVAQPMAGLRLSSPAAVRKLVTPGDPESSRLISAVRYTNPNLQMPPRGRLSDTEVRALEEWVRLGAADPRQEETSAQPKRSGIDYERGRKHWAFQPLRPVAGSIDEWAGLTGEEANRRTLLRRVYFDVIGLPPAPSEVEAFLEDKSPDAWTRVVDRLLASPQFGERWARHWLDLVRYAETDGHEFDVDKPNAFRYRDWVIRAFNQDMPFPQFVRQQIAGDLTGTPEGNIASGFAWMGEIINTPVDSVEALANRIDNQVDVFGKAFLGLTIACARCHDHKFDPIATADYYSLAGFFHSSRPRQANIDPPDRVELIRAVLAQLPQRALPRTAPPTAGGEYEVFEDFNAKTYEGWKRTGEAFGAGPIDGLATTAAFTGRVNGILISKIFRIDKRFIHVRMAGKGKVRLVADEYTNGSRTLTGDSRMTWKTIDARMGQGNLGYMEIEDLDRDSYITVDRIVFSSSKAPPPDPPGEPVEYAAASALEDSIPSSEYALANADDEARDVRIHIRGSHKNLGDMAPRRFLPVLASLDQAPIAAGSGRRELADRMLRTAQPLMARVAANRIWSQYFGDGIVPTVDNFGMTGDRPSKPELLEYLAGRLVSSGGSLKAIHREILLSRAYRLSTRGAGRKVRRLDAEALRDGILAVSGMLDPKMSGPSVAPFVSPWMDGDPRGKPKSGPVDGAGRRSIYINVRRNYLTDMFLTFDYPLPITTIGRRGVSTVASQALYMMNSGFIAGQANQWAARIESSGLPDTAARIDRMYEEAFSRLPANEEREAARQFLEHRTLADFAHVLLNTTEFLYLR